MTQKLYLIIALLCTLAGTTNTAWAWDVTVTYTIDLKNVNDADFIVFTPDNTGINSNNGEVKVEYSLIQNADSYTFTLNDGIKMAVSLSNAPSSNSMYFYNSVLNFIGNATFTFSSGSYYIKHIAMRNNNGNAISVYHTGGSVQDPFLFDVDVDLDKSRPNVAPNDVTAYSAISSSNQVGVKTISVTYGTTPRDYTISYVNAVNGQDDVANENPTSYNVATGNITLIAPSRTGYTFGGFYDNEQMTGSPINLTNAIRRGEAATRKDITLYAKWNIITYAITLVKQGGSGGTESVTVSYGGSVPNIVPPVKEHATFMGYYTAENGEGEKYYDANGIFNTNKVITADITLYAHWWDNIPYIDAAGKVAYLTDYTKIKDFKSLSSEPNADQWVVVDGISCIDEYINIYNANIILKDGGNFGFENSIIGCNGAKIYAQSKGDNMGTFIVMGGFTGDDLTICGGNVGEYGNVDLNNLTIHDGEISFKGNTTLSGNLTIDGGNIELIAKVTGDVNIGWTNLEDRIKILFLDDKTVTVKSGQGFIDDSKNLFTGQISFAKESWNNLYPAILMENSAANSATIANYAGKQINFALKDRTIYADGAWNTICHPHSTSLECNGLITPTDFTIMELDTEGKYNAAGGADANGEYQTGIRDGILYLYFKEAQAIEAGKPYIIKTKTALANDMVNPGFKDVTIADLSAYSGTDAEKCQALLEAKAATSKDGKVRFIGTFDPVTLTGGDKSVLYLGDENTLYYPASNMTIGAFRCYFQLTDPVNEVRAFRLGFGEETQGINSLTPGPSPIGEGSIYTLSGVKVDGQRSMVNGQRSMVNGQRSMVNGQRSMVNGQRSMVNGQLRKGLYIQNGRKVLIK